MTKELKKGFTLLELIITIAIVGILTTIFISTSAGSTKRARDAGRKSDIHQYQNSLEIYAGKNNTLYPSQTAAQGVQASTTLCANLSLTGCPEDPLNSKDASYFYKYQTDGGGEGTPTATKYVLWAQLEITSNYWVVCSNGKTGNLTTISVSGGICPLP